MPKTILVVDDEQNIARLVEFNLKGAGYEVRRAMDGAEGLAAVRTERPDLVLLDCNMPNMDGMEMLAELKKDRCLRDIPVIMLTAKSETEDLWRGVDAGVEYYVTKPIDPQQLLDLIARYFEEHR